MGLSTEMRAARTGLAIVAACAAWFVAFKLSMWNSVVVHAEPSSIHRLFFGRVLLRFPQEPFNLVDFLTTTFLVVAGVTALGVAFGMGERLRLGTARRSGDARYLRGFFGMAGIGLVWVGLDEIFLIHEFASANLLVPDHWFLGAYGAAALAVCVVRWKALITSRVGLAVLALGALLHGGAIGLDFFQEQLGWVPEEPIEMIAAGCYATAMAVYAARLFLAFPASGAAAFAESPGGGAMSGAAAGFSAEAVLAAGVELDGAPRGPSRPGSEERTDPGIGDPMPPVAGGPEGALPRDPSWVR